jgi:hypothetical protein
MMIQDYQTKKKTSLFRQNGLKISYNKMDLNKINSKKSFKIDPTKTPFGLRLNTLSPKYNKGPMKSRLGRDSPSLTP